MVPKASPPSQIQAFTSVLDGRGLRMPADLAALGESLQTALEAARSAWPGLAIDGAELARGLAERLDPDEDPLLALRQVRAADFALAQACARGDALALR